MRDLKFAFRQLVKNPVISTIAVLTLALGIGANTAIFSILDSLMLQMLPVADPQRLVLFGTGAGVGSTDGMPSGPATLFSYPMFREMQRNNTVFTDVAAMKSIILDVHGRLQGRNELEKLRVEMVSGSYFPVLGLNAGSGRLFTDADDRTPGGHPIAVANHAWWTRQFPGQSFDSAKTVAIGSTVYTIVGLTPPKFFGTTLGDAPNFWIPLSMEAQITPGWNGLTNRFFQAHHVIARLKPEVSGTKAEAEINLVFKRTLQAYAGPQPSQTDMEAIAQARIDLTPAATGLSRLRSQFAKPLQFLFAVVTMVLLIACANVANLMLARALGRSREIAIRMAVGAGRSRLFRQLLTESMLLAGTGGVLGLVLAHWAAALLVALVANGQSAPLEVAIDLRVLGFTFVIAVVTALLFGIAPALRATRVDCLGNLQEGKGASAHQSRNALARALLVGQVAISLALLGAAGLFLRTLGNLARVEMGFKKENVLLFQLDASSAGHKEDSRLVRLHQEIEQAVQNLPGIQAASFSFFTFNQGGWTTPITTSKPLSGSNPNVAHNVIGPAYFSTMGIPLLTGRGFDSRDTETSLKVAVVNETFARVFFPSEGAVGQRYRIGNLEAQNEIVGVVKDAKYEDLRERPRPAAYYPHTQQIQYLSDFEIRYAGDATAAIAAVRETVAKIDPNLPFAYVRTLSEEIDRSIVDQRLTAQLSSFFALLALFLACIGIYGVTSHTVTRQTREIGIRMALGAQRKQVLLLILRQTLLVLVGGLALGVPAVLALRYLVSSQLYGVPPIDPISLSIASALLVVAATIAGYLPSRQATRVDPMEALRCE